MPEALAEAANVEAVESPIESTETVETEPIEPGESGSEETPSENTEQVNAKPISLTDQVKKNRAALKAIDPKFADAIQAMVFRDGRLAREFPGGLNEAIQLKQTISEFGGREGLQESQEALADYGSLEEMFEKGDRQFIERLADAAPQSFSAIMPAGLEKWKAVDGETYNHVMAQIMIQTLDSAKVSQTLAQIWQATEKKELKDAIESIWNVIDGYREVASKAPERKVDPQNEALNRREQELNQREMRTFMAPISSSGRQQIADIVNSEMTRGYQWSETSQDVQDAIRERVTAEIVNASKKDKTFSDNFARYRDRQDAKGLENHIKSFQAKVGPAIVQKVARLFNVKPKISPSGTKVVNKAAPVTQTAVPKGWERISRQPTPGEIDRVRTTADMIMDNKAIMKSGKKVMWA